MTLTIVQLWPFFFLVFSLISENKLKQRNTWCINAFYILVVSSWPSRGHCTRGRTFCVPFWKKKTTMVGCHWLRAGRPSQVDTPVVRLSFTIVWTSVLDKACCIFEKNKNKLHCRVVLQMWTKPRPRPALRPLHWPHWSSFTSCRKTLNLCVLDLAPSSTSSLWRWKQPLR